MDRMQLYSKNLFVKLLACKAAKLLHLCVASAKIQHRSHLSRRLMQALPYIRTTRMYVVQAWVVSNILQFPLNSRHSS